VDNGFLYFPTKKDLSEDLDEIHASLGQDATVNIEDFESTRIAVRFCTRLNAWEFLNLQQALGWSHHSAYAYPPRMKNFEQKFLGFLHNQGKATNIAEALRVHFAEFSERSSLNRIRNSELFTVLDGGLVKIREEGYTQARTISEMVDEALGSKNSITLDELTHYILSRRAAAKSSIRSYASTFPFQLHAGVVTRAEIPRPPQSQIAKTKRLYRIDEGWRLRLRLNEEMMRGSSVQMPTSIVGALELPGDTRKEFWSEQLGETIWVSWQGMQPRIQAVRKAALALEGRVNDYLLIDFLLGANLINFRIVKFPIDKQGLEGVAALLGVNGDGDVGPRISKLIMSSDNGGLSIIETLQLRKEYDAIEVFDGIS
jgi:hypothetical protein